ncbi:MAG: septum site-determining protein MinD [Eubacteriaceae bacterium]|nr:septum site-determining protein MinD [Eubacteriaceae bacterium]
MMGKVIVIVSGKGGTGKTMFAANMGALLAMRGKKVVLLDMDMGLRNLDLHLGLENRVVYNVMDVLSGMCRIKQALIRDKRFKELYLIAASPNRDERDITPLHMEILCEKLKKEFDYILIDSPAGIGDGLALAAAAADKAVVVTEAELTSVRDADAIDRELIKMGILDRCCVFNKVKGELMSLGAMPGLSSISRSLRLRMAGAIQYDDNIYISTNRGVPIVLKPGTYIEKNFNKILDRILEEGS